MKDNIWSGEFLPIQWGRDRIEVTGSSVFEKKKKRASYTLTRATQCTRYAHTTHVFTPFSAHSNTQQPTLSFLSTLNFSSQFLIHSCLSLNSQDSRRRETGQWHTHLRRKRLCCHQTQQSKLMLLTVSQSSLTPTKPAPLRGPQPNLLLHVSTSPSSSKVRPKSELGKRQPKFLFWSFDSIVYSWLIVICNIFYNIHYMLKENFN